MGQFQGNAEFSTWLYRLVVNVCVDVARGRKPEIAIGDRSRLEAFAAPGSPEKDLDRFQTASSVRAAVAALPPKFRIAVLLRYFEDFSYAQMAKALNCSMGTVASRLSRGHKLLAERLKSLAGTKV
jgi:RNA polymerase sigma-70 factor (ECF subfamily)